MTHFLLDTRSTYQRIRDWILSLFRSKHTTQEREVTRFLTSYERDNRARLKTFSTIRPIESKNGSRGGSSKTSHKIRVCHVPLEKVAGRNSYSPNHCDLNDSVHSISRSLEYHAPPRQLERVNSLDCISRYPSYQASQPLLKRS